LHFGGGIIKNKPWHVFTIARGKERADYGEETEQTWKFSSRVLRARAAMLSGRAAMLSGRAAALRARAEMLSGRAGSGKRINYFRLLLLFGFQLLCNLSFMGLLYK